MNAMQLSVLLFLTAVAISTSTPLGNLNGSDNNSSLVEAEFHMSRNESHGNQLKYQMNI